MEYAVSGGDLVDATSGVLAEMVKSKPKEIEKRVRLDKRDGIVFNSTKGSGKNLVLYKNYGMLKDKGGAQDATAGFEKYKSDTVNERMKGTNPGDISKGVSGSDMSETL